MASTQGQKQNRTKIRIFRFLQLAWTQILTGQLVIDTTDKKIKILYENSSNDHLIPSCTPSYDEDTKTKCITIEFTKLSKIQQEDSDRKILYVWIDVNPFSFSFLSQQRATQVCQIFQLFQQNIELTQNQTQNGQFGLEFIQNCLQDNPTMLTMLCLNNKSQILQVLLKALKLSTQQNHTQEQKQNYFHIFQTAIKVSEKPFLQTVLEPVNYPTVLQILSWNPFNKQKFDYQQEYASQIKIKNTLKLTNQKIMKAYAENARIRFLRDVAACMFIQMENQRIMLNIINSNNLDILEELAHNQTLFEEIGAIGDTDPRGFMNIFTELWEIYRATTVEYQNKYIKEDFAKLFKQKKLHNCALSAITKILDSPELMAEIPIRFHEKWIQAFNPFLSINWQFSQQWICNRQIQAQKQKQKQKQNQKSKQKPNSKQLQKQKQNQILKKQAVDRKGNLLQVLLRLLSQVPDESLFQTTIGFIKWFIQPSDNRSRMDNKFTSYVYQQFVGKLWDKMKSSVALIQIYVDFMLKIYKIDYVRTRRVMIENRVLKYLDDNLTKKAILICVIKILDAFMDASNFDVFVYMYNHHLFTGLREQYLRNASSRNVVNSCFRSLMNKIKATKSYDARRFYQQVFLTPKEDNQITSA